MGTPSMRGPLGAETAVGRAKIAHVFRDVGHTENGQRPSSVEVGKRMVYSSRWRATGKNE